MEVESLKKSDLDEKEKMSRLEKAKEVVASALHGGQEQYREVTTTVAPLLDALAPACSSISHGALVGRLHQTIKGVAGLYKWYGAHLRIHVLFLVKALYPNQDMKPFVEGWVPDVADGEYVVLEKQVEDTTKATMERLDFWVVGEFMWGTPNNICL